MSSEVITRNDLKNVLNELLPVFYPVGSYYETSDTTFNPNVSWGGTWELETAGQVHVSSGTNYQVSGALTNTTDGGATTHLHSTGDKALDITQIPSHNHNSKTLTCSIAPLYWSTQQNKTSGIATIANGNKDRTAGSGTNLGTATTTINATHTHDSQGDGKVHNHGNTGSTSNMQPYIVVNRWHRTA